jgi:hypothetical protein
MESNKVKAFTKGVYNKLENEDIPQDAAQDSKNFITRDGKIILIGGRVEVDTQGAVGNVTGLHIGYKVDGSTVQFAKFGTVIKYLDSNNEWQDCITGLEADEDYSFANYSSLAGAFTFVNGKSKFYKIVNAIPGSPISMYNSSKNYYGRIMIDRGRMILWNRDNDKTGLYGSKIDPQDSTVYTTVAGEAIGALGSKDYNGTLGFMSSIRRTCFNVSFTALTGAGQETFVDDYLGNLTSNKGGTGTINYATGVYDISFNGTTTGAVTAGYQWESSDLGGVADFTYSAVRVAGEGFQFPQDEGGDAILNVLVGIDGTYYSLKSKSAYSLSLDADDTGGTNLLYRKDLGLLNWQGAISTNQGIVFINSANPSDPTMVILKKDNIGVDTVPFDIFTQFDFTKYDFTDAFLGNYDRWVLVFCKKQGSSKNDTILMCDLKTSIIDIIEYTGRYCVQDGGDLFVGDSITETVYKTFNGFDDLGLSIGNFWTSKTETFGADDLKKIRRLRLKGKIDPDQTVKVFISYDDTDFELVGTISGKASYVNYTVSETIGGNFIGEDQIGGDDITNIYPFYCEIKIKTPKFRSRAIKFEATEIGYFELESMTDWGILEFEDRIPKIYRQKQNVSLDGESTNN